MLNGRAFLLHSLSEFICQNKLCWGRVYFCPNQIKQKKPHWLSLKKNTILLLQKQNILLYCCCGVIKFRLQGASKHPGSLRLDAFMHWKPPAVEMTQPSWSACHSSSLFSCRNFFSLYPFYFSRIQTYASCPSVLHHSVSIMENVLLFHWNLQWIIVFILF